MVRIISEREYGIRFRDRPWRERNVWLSIDKSVMDSIRLAASKAAKRDCETLGLLIGRRYRDARGIYGTVARIATSPLVADRTSVKFDPDGMGELFDKLDNMLEDEHVIGWYHSHVGCGCHLSRTDVDTHRGMFGDDQGFAIVVDPLKRETRAFASKPFLMEVLIKERE